MINLNTVLDDIVGDDENTAIALYQMLSDRFYWAGTIFQRVDVEDMYLRLIEADGGTVTTMPEDVWNDFRNTRAWCRAMSEQLCERGWDIIADALADYINTPT